MLLVLKGEAHGLSPAPWELQDRNGLDCMAHAARSCCPVLLSKRVQCAGISLLAAGTAAGAAGPAAAGAAGAGLGLLAAPAPSMEWRDGRAKAGLPTTST
jgi:hypothetical protein